MRLRHYIIATLGRWKCRPAEGYRSRREDVRCFPSFAGHCCYTTFWNHGRVSPESRPRSITPVPSHSCDDILYLYASCPPPFSRPAAVRAAGSPWHRNMVLVPQAFSSRETSPIPPFPPRIFVLGLSCYVISTSYQGPGASSRVAGVALPECVTAGIRDTGSAGCGAPAGRRKGSPRAAAGTYSREVASLRISTRQAKDPSPSQLEPPG
jgi:hypothetical protein